MMSLSEGLTALHNAVLGGHLDIAKFLIERCRVDSTFKDSRGWTSLHFACKGGHLMMQSISLKNRTVIQPIVIRMIKHPFIQHV